MALIDTINQMKQQGMSDNEVAQNLQEQGYSSQEIFNTLSQASIKPAFPQVQGTQESAQQNFQEMQPSMMPIPQQPQAFPVQQPVTQELQEGYPQSYGESYPQQSYEQYPQEQYAPYQQQQGYEEYLPSTSDTMTEIAEEIVEEKLRKLTKAISGLTEIKTDIDEKINNLSSRIKRIENIIDNLNSAILKKVSIYGEDLADIKSELTSTQESFSKIINPLVDKARRVEKREPTNRQEKKKSGVEHYLRR